MDHVQEIIHCILLFSEEQPTDVYISLDIMDIDEIIEERMVRNNSFLRFVLLFRYDFINYMKSVLQALCEMTKNYR